MRTARTSPLRAAAHGKSSLVLRAGQRAIRKGILVGYCDLMRTPTKERFAAALAKTIYGDLESAAGQAIERATRLFRGLRITPTMEVDPVDGSLRFVFHAGRRRAAIDDTIEALLALPGQIAAERGRRAVLVFDEFQEIVTLDRHYPKLMRAVFQEQPEVGHVYLGSKRHLLERIFDDANEPFWRSAKRLEIGTIPAAFARFLRRRFEETEKAIDDDALARLLEATGGHPYGTQELAYFLWELVPTGHFARRGTSRRPWNRCSARSTTTSPSSGTMPHTPSASSCSRWRRSRPARSTRPTTPSGTTSPPSRRSSAPSARS